MINLYTVAHNKLIRKCESETLLVEPWGENSFRIRVSQMSDSIQGQDWALSELPEVNNFQVNIEDGAATVKHGNIILKINAYGKLTFFNEHGKLLLEEFVRTRKDLFSKDCSALELEAREFRPTVGGDYKLTARFSSFTEEKIYGMGQYQQPFLNIKGCMLELAQRNSQASVPFMLSNMGYGFLWNNPAIGNVTFGKNIIQWEAKSTKILDYWITAGNTPAEIVEAYAGVTGTVPMMPEYGLGFWQSKLRYQTQEELLNVARKYMDLGHKIDVIVVDYFHWVNQGDWKFDSTYWPDPKAMIEELKDMGIELMISVWPTVDFYSENFEEMKIKGYLIHADHGPQSSMDFIAPTLFCDMTNPDARDYLWNKCRENYYDKGSKVFWLDVAEPEYSTYDFENYRYFMGTNLQIGNIYPLMYAKTFFDGLRAEGEENIVNLLRCAWAGSQKYGSLVWSGDIHSSFESMRNQLAAGLNMGVAGIPWWTTDIGGFHGGDPGNPSFKELFTRWFQWGAFCPVMRLHGDREPKQPQYGSTGGCHCLSGMDNEIWSYGDEIYTICVKYMNIREKMRPYTRQLMQQAHKNGTPIIRTMFYEYPDDQVCWDTEDQYFYGPDIMVAPIMYESQRDRSVYLPAGNWVEYETNKAYSGNQHILVNAPIDQIPIFVREGKCIL